VNRVQILNDFTTASTIKQKLEKGDGFALPFGATVFLHVGDPIQRPNPVPNLPNHSLTPISHQIQQRRHSILLCPQTTASTFRTQHHRQPRNPRNLKICLLALLARRNLRDHSRRILNYANFSLPVLVLRHQREEHRNCA